MIETMRWTLWKPVSVFALLTLVSGPTAAEELEAFTEPYKRAAVPAPEIGVIAEILVKEGDEISQKQVLAKLDDTVLRASLEVAKSAKDALGARRSAETDLLMREKQLESYRELRERGNATQRELDRSESEHQQSASRLQSVREDLEVRRLEYERVKTQIKQRVIESPIDGFVIAIDKEVGEFVSPTDPIIMQVVHLDTLKSVFSVPLDVAQDLRPGQNVELRVGYKNQSCNGIIEFVSPIVDAESSTVRTKIRIPNQDGKIQSGVVCRWDLEFETPVEKTSRKWNGEKSSR
jgi:RND family efflux transporter MFP subunit